MKIHYQDEYFTDLYIDDSDIVPTKGSKVALGDFDYFIKDVTYRPEERIVEILLVEMMEREVKSPDDSGRLNTMEAAIFAVNKRQDELHKKHRNLREQVSTVRTHINQQLHNERKSK